MDSQPMMTGMRKAFRLDMLGLGRVFKFVGFDAGQGMKTR